MRHDSSRSEGIAVKRKQGELPGVHTGSAGSMERTRVEGEIGYGEVPRNHEMPGGEIGYPELSGDHDGGRAPESEWIAVPGHGHRIHLFPAMSRDYTPAPALFFMISPGLPRGKE